MGRHMQVYVRIFPLPNRNWQYLEVSKDFKEIYIQSKVVKSSLWGNQAKYIRFPASGVFVNNSQEEIYRTLSQDIFTKIFNGENVIIMSTGQHGSGKSFSMTGYCGLYENRGISLRLVDDLFYEIESRKLTLKTELFLSYIDFASESMIDLLTEPASHIFHINDIKKLKVNSKEELIKWMLLGEKRRWIEGINSNCATSVITFYLKCVSRVKSEPYDYSPQIQLIELCGTQSGTGCQIKSNRDLSDMSLYLASNKIVALSRSPSKLVGFLSSTWNNAFIRVLCHLKPVENKRHLNLATLLFVNRLMKRPKYCLDLRRTENPLNNFRYAIDMIRQLEDELLVREMIIGEGFRYAETVSQNEMDYVLSACKQYLQGEISIESLLSTAHPHILVLAMKKQFEQLKTVDKIDKTDYQIEPETMRTTSRIEKLSFLKLGSTKKRQGQKDRKGRQTIDRTDSIRVTLVNEDSEEITNPQGIPDRKTIEAEFYTRYPEVKDQLDLAVDNYKKSLTIRDEMYAEYNQLKREAQEEIKTEEDKLWRYRVDIGECIGPYGTTEWAPKEEKRAQDAAMAAKRQTLDAIRAYTNARDTLTELKTSIDERMQNYMEVAYGTWNPITVEIKPCYLEKSDGLNEVQVKNPSIDDIKKQDLFYKIQYSHKNGIPFKKKPRWL